MLLSMGTHDHAAYVIVNTARKGEVPRIPLVQEKDPTGMFPFLMWKLPGGTKEGYESPETTALREVREETGIGIQRPKSPLVQEDVAFPEPHLFLVYGAEAPGLSERDIKKGTDVEAVALFTVKQVRKLIKKEKLLPRHARALELYFRRLGY